MSSKIKWVSLLPFLGLVGCGNSDLPDYFLLDRLRVVAVTTSTGAAEFSPGDSVTVSFHITDPKGAGRALTYSVIQCVDPGVNLGATPSCTGNPTATSPVTGTLVPGSAGTNYYGVLTPPAFTIPAAGVVFLDPRTGSARTAADQYNGVGYLVLITVSASSTEVTTAFKRVVVSTKTTKNQNPTFASPELLFAGSTASTYSLTNDAFSMAAQVVAGSAETYAIQNTDGTFTPGTEALTLTWLVSSGKARYSRTDVGVENRFTPENPIPAITTFIAVLRDDRGGAAIFSVSRP